MTAEQESQLSYRRDGDTVQLSMTCDQYRLLIAAIAFAVGSMPDREFRIAMIRLVNALNDGNPEWTPYAEAAPAGGKRGGNVSD